MSLTLTPTPTLTLTLTLARTGDLAEAAAREAGGEDVDKGLMPIVSRYLVICGDIETCPPNVMILRHGHGIRG